MFAISVLEIYHIKKKLMFEKYNFSKAQIVDNIQIASNTFLLSFERFFEFKAGQWVALKLLIDESPRLYSIASGTNSELVEILYDVKPDGQLTGRMSKLKKGDSIYVSEPSGEFLCEKGEAMFIATGTGIAPFRSMILSGFGEDKKLIFGARKLELFYFDKDFEEYFGENYVKCCSGEAADNVFKGRVTDYFRNLKQININQKYYLCGRSEMVVELRDILIERNVPFKNIIAEIYF